MLRKTFGLQKRHTNHYGDNREYHLTRLGEELQATVLFTLIVADMLHHA